MGKHKGLTSGQRVGLVAGVAAVGYVGLVAVGRVKVSHEGAEVLALGGSMLAAPLIVATQALYAVGITPPWSARGPQQQVSPDALAVMPRG